MSKECQRESLPQKRELYSSQVAQLHEKGFQTALKILQILEARKNPEDHPDYLPLKDELERIKGELKK